MTRKDLRGGQALPVRSVSLRPVVKRYGAMWIDWDEADYCAWFASSKGWLPSDTIRQPIGLLDQLVDNTMQDMAERQREAERQKNRRPF